MLPRKAIIAAVVLSLLLFGHEGLSGERSKGVPNLLLGFAAVGALSAARSLKEIFQPIVRSL